jgi:hypothetical protein
VCNAGGAAVQVTWSAITRRRAAGACWVIRAIDRPDRAGIAPGRGWAGRSGKRAIPRPGISGAASAMIMGCDWTIANACWSVPRETPVLAATGWRAAGAPQGMKKAPQTLRGRITDFSPEEPRQVRRRGVS